MIHAFADWVFSHVCHQEIARCWAPGGVPLALCERCVGVYVGAALLLFAVPLMRFGPTKTLLILHAFFVLQMTVFGYHLLPHPPTARTLSGQLFMTGVFFFLWNHLRHNWAFFQGNRSPRPYLLAVLAATLVLQLLVRAPFPVVAPFIEFLALLGLLTIALAATATVADLLCQVRKKT